MEIEMTCRLCGRTFTAKQINAMYCCKACKQMAYRINSAKRVGTVYADVRIKPRGGDVR